MTTTWVAVAQKKSRETLPRLQRELDAARSRVDELSERLTAVERAAAVLDPDGDSDLAVVVRVAAELLPPVVAKAETAVAEATTARREARAALLPEESVWSKLSAARQADRHAQAKLDAARLRLGQLQRGGAVALATVRDTPPGGNMLQLAAAEAELRMGERALPAARDAVAAAEAVAQEARSAVEAMEARARTLRATVLTGEPEQAEAALVELLSLVGEERSGLTPR